MKIFLEFLFHFLRFKYFEYFYKFETNCHLVDKNETINMVNFNNHLHRCQFSFGQRRNTKTLFKEFIE